VLNQLLLLLLPRHCCFCFCCCCCSGSKKAHFIDFDITKLQFCTSYIRAKKTGGRIKSKSPKQQQVQQQQQQA
jgi:hypothetical protein